MHEMLPFRLTAEARMRLIVKRCPAFGAVVEKICELDGEIPGATDLADRLEGGSTPDSDKLTALLQSLSPIRKLALADFFHHVIPSLKISWDTAASVLEYDGNSIGFAKSELKLLETVNPAVLDIWWNLAESQETDEAEFTVHYAAACVAKLQRTHLAARLMEKRTATGG